MMKIISTMMRLEAVTIILMCLVPSMSAQAADILCPDVEQERSNAPGDVTGVQADIERLNLCVERAKLLKQLDDIAKQRADTLKKITDPAADLVGSMGGIPGMAGSSLPPLPTTTTGLIDPSTLKPGDVRITNAAGNPLEGAGGGSSSGGQKWKVRKIWGQSTGTGGSAMRAQLTDGTGTLLNISKGDLLPDGKTVESISVKGVAISQNGKIHDLSWDDAADSSPTPAGLAAAPKPVAPAPASATGPASSSARQATPSTPGNPSPAQPLIVPRAAGGSVGGPISNTTTPAFSPPNTTQ